MAQHVLAVLGAHAHQVLAVAARLERAPCRPPVEITDIRHELSPLAGQQVARR